MQRCQTGKHFVLGVVRIGLKEKMNRALLMSLKGISVNEQTHQSAISQPDDDRRQ